MSKNQSRKRSGENHLFSSMMSISAKAAAASASQTAPGSPGTPGESSTQNPFNNILFPPSHLSKHFFLMLNNNYNNSTNPSAGGPPNGDDDPLMRNAQTLNNDFRNNSSVIVTSTSSSSKSNHGHGHHSKPSSKHHTNLNLWARVVKEKDKIKNKGGHSHGGGSQKHQNQHHQQLNNGDLGQNQNKYKVVDYLLHLLAFNTLQVTTSTIFSNNDNNDTNNSSNNDSNTTTNITTTTTTTTPSIKSQLMNKLSSSSLKSSSFVSTPVSGSEVDVKPSKSINIDDSISKSNCSTTSTINTANSNRVSLTLTPKMVDNNEGHIVSPTVSNINVNTTDRDGESSDLKEEVKVISQSQDKENKENDESLANNSVQRGFVQLSGHPGSIAPAGPFTLWKKMGAGSHELKVYEELFNNNNNNNGNNETKVLDSVPNSSSTSSELSVNLDVDLQQVNKDLIEIIESSTSSSVSSTSLNEDQQNQNQISYTNNNSITSIIPRFFSKIDWKDQTFLEIEDLFINFNCHCSKTDKKTIDSIDRLGVVDIKMGSRTFLESEVSSNKLREDLYKKMLAIDPKAPTEKEHELKAITKLRYMQFREDESSTSTLGFRIDAIKYPNISLIDNNNEENTNTTEDIVDDTNTNITNTIIAQENSTSSPSGSEEKKKESVLDKITNKEDHLLIKKLKERVDVRDILKKFLTYPFVNSSRLSRQEVQVQEMLIAKALLKKLNEIRVVLENSQFFKEHELIGSSILIIYDFSYYNKTPSNSENDINKNLNNSLPPPVESNSNQNQKSNTIKVKLGAWLIDFAKTICHHNNACNSNANANNSELNPEETKSNEQSAEAESLLDHRKKWELGNHEDGFLTGLDNLIKILEEVIQ